MRTTAAVLAVAASGIVGAAPAQAQDDYSNPAYLQHDLDNYTRARAKMYADAQNPEYAQKFAAACVDSQARAAAKQIEDAENGRVYGGVGQATCWWSVGDAADYNKVRPQRVSFLARTGAKLQGHLWTDGDEGRKPGVVITTGSIQASDQMYWWAARALAARGYAVLTYDVQGQGQSETFGHAPGSPAPTTENVPSQQDANFFDGTVDALRYFLSTKADPYVPAGWTAEEVAAAKGASDGDELSWSNPQAGDLLAEDIGIIGHSLGARAITAVQQCSDRAELWRTLALCTGRSFPIKAAVAWDALGTNAQPVVPAMSQNSDGYFLFPTFSRTAPDKREHLGAYEHWRKAGVDVYSYTVRAGTHIEWSQVPYTPATTYGAAMNAFYTLAWLDRYVHPSDDRNAEGQRALLEGPRDDEGPGSASYFSARRLSAFSLAGVGETDDLRQYFGKSRVGDWAGANADKRGAFLP